MQVATWMYTFPHPPVQPIFPPAPTTYRSHGERFRPLVCYNQDHSRSRHRFERVPQREALHQSAEPPHPQSRQSCQGSIPPSRYHGPQSRSYLGAQYRRLRTRRGAPKAITAMAHKLACLFYRLVTKGRQYVDRGIEYYESQYREQQTRFVMKRAQQLGLQVIQPQEQTA